jgi:hypothetical protein
MALGVLGVLGVPTYELLASGGVRKQAVVPRPVAHCRQS